MKKIIIGTVLAVILISALLAGCSSGTGTSPTSTNQTFTLKMQSAYPHGDLSMELTSKFAEYAKEKSNGRLNIEVFADPEIVPSDQLLESTKRGTLDIFHAGGTYWGGIVPVGDVEFSLPNMFPVQDYTKFPEQAEDIRKFYYDSGFVDILREEYGKQNLYWLDMHTYGPSLYVTTKPVKTMADMKGLKIREQGAWSVWHDKMGAVGVEGGGGDTYLELKLGTLDAAGWDLSAITGLKWNEVAPYLMRGADTLQFGHIQINKNKWNSLPSDLQQVLKDAGKYYWDLTVEGYAQVIKECEDIKAKGGYQEVWLDADAQAKHQQYAVEIWNEYAKHDAASAKAIDLIKKYRGIQ